MEPPALPSAGMMVLISAWCFRSSLPVSPPSFRDLVVLPLENVLTSWIFVTLLLSPCAPRPSRNHSPYGFSQPPLHEFLPKVPGLLGRTTHTFSPMVFFQLFPRFLIATLTALRGHLLRGPGFNGGARDWVSHFGSLIGWSTQFEILSPSCRLFRFPDYGSFSFGSQTRTGKLIRARRKSFKKCFSPS